MRNNGIIIYRANAGVTVVKSTGIHGGMFYGIVVSGVLIDGIHRDSVNDAARFAVYEARSRARAMRTDL